MFKKTELLRMRTGICASFDRLGGSIDRLCASIDRLIFLKQTGRHTERVRQIKKLKMLTLLGTESIPDLAGYVCA